MNKITIIHNPKNMSELICMYNDICIFHSVVRLTTNLIQKVDCITCININTTLLNDLICYCSVTNIGITKYNNLYRQTCKQSFVRVPKRHNIGIGSHSSSLCIKTENNSINILAGQLKR